MHRNAMIFGGTGYIGIRLARYLRERGWSRVLLADIRPPSEELPVGVDHIHCDVRQPIAQQIDILTADWIFNFAAVHREPGHHFKEYFDTNLPGAKNVCAYADLIGCRNLLFTSSIAVYGKITQPTDESFTPYPETGYGISKFCSELIHAAWQQQGHLRRLIIVRPGVVYGPRDPGNMLRMIRALQKGIFIMPGDGMVRKSYAYIYGLIESMEFMMERPESYLCYNYVEKNTETLTELVRHACMTLGLRPPRLRVPKGVLIAIARLAQITTMGHSPIHPVRVKKAAMSTHIVPANLIRLGFDFRYNFEQSLHHWMDVEPQDFLPRSPITR